MNDSPDWEQSASWLDKNEYDKSKTSSFIKQGHNYCVNDKQDFIH